MKNTLFFFILLVFFKTTYAQKRPIDYVNPFIGTGGHGHTFPGATTPFGMVQLSPDTRTEGWDAAGGYHYSDSTILGFSHTHLNGTGINDFCDILLLPMGLNAEQLREKSRNKALKSRFQHKNEIAQAGYYKTYLDDLNVQVELTASERVGFHRYKFPDSVKTACLYLDLNHRDMVIDKAVRKHSVRTDKDDILFGLSGKRISRSWAKTQHLYFALEANAFSHSIFFSTQNDNQVVYLFDVSKTHELLVKVALSPVSEENAIKNLQAEIPHWDFDKTRKEAEEKWSKYLNRIQIEGGTEEQRTIFYTALYHTLIHPSVWQDVNGEYRGLDNEVHQTYKFQYHSIFSLWDTYRALHPLYTILCPEKIPDFINGFIDDFEKSGHLPMWNFPGNETWCMVGNHSIPVIADAFLKGIKGFDAKKALNAMVKTAKRDTLGLKVYREKGYIPADAQPESVSKTLDYAYDDYCIAMMAYAMKEDEIYREFKKRSDNWKNLYNPKTGYFQAKMNETFIEPFDPREMNFHFTEGNAWQYSFLVQHDVEGLIKLQGGKERFEVLLDSFFNTSSHSTGREISDVTGLIGQYAHGNEPSHHIAYLYNYVGKPEKTQRLVRQIMQDFYKNDPDGLIGNEDCGQMSAWFVLSAMGAYPVDPISNHVENGFKLFDKIKILRDNKYAEYKKEDYFNIENVSKLYLGKDYKPGSFVLFPPIIISHYYNLTTPFVSKGSKFFKEKQTIELSSVKYPDGIFYTTDGSDPQVSGVKYTKPIEIDDTKTIKFVSSIKGPYGSTEYSKTATATFKKIDKTTTVTLKNPPAPQYSGGVEDALADGEFGNEYWQLGGWQGFEGVDLEAVIDFKNEVEFNRVVIRCMEDQNSWIFPPAEVEFYTSNDGVNFQLLSTQKPDVTPNTEGAIIRHIGCRKHGKARYVKVVAKPLKPIPDWHKGAGGKGWIFADEIYTTMRADD